MHGAGKSTSSSRGAPCTKWQPRWAPTPLPSSPLHFPSLPHPVLTHPQRAPIPHCTPNGSHSGEGVLALSLRCCPSSSIRLQPIGDVHAMAGQHTTSLCVWLAGWLAGLCGVAKFSLATSLQQLGSVRPSSAQLSSAQLSSAQLRLAQPSSAQLRPGQLLQLHLFAAAWPLRSCLWG